MNTFQIFLQKNRVLIGIFSLALILRLINLNQSFWLDEAAQVIESSRSFWQQFDIAADFHPPLFHILLHFWMKLGTSEVWIRTLSILFSLGSIGLIYKTGDQLGNRNVGILAALFVTISPYHIWYSQEARPYMLFVFLSLFCTLMLLQKRWGWYILFAILAAYTLYFAPFLLLSHLLYILLFGRGQRKNIFLAFSAVAIFFLPWFPFFLTQLATGTSGLFSGWTNVVSVSSVVAIPQIFAKFILGKISLSHNPTAVILLLPEMMLFGVSCMLLWKKEMGKILSILFFAPIIFSLIVNLFIPIVAPQRLLFLLPLFSLILSWGILTLRKPLKIFSLVLVVMVSVIGLWQYYADPHIQRENWRQSVSFVNDSETPNSMILFAFPEPFAPFQWYYKGNSPARGVAPEFILSDDDMKMLDRLVEGKDTVYFYQYLTGLTDPQMKIHRFLAEHTYREDSIKDFPGVGFVYVYKKI